MEKPSTVQRTFKYAKPENHTNLNYKKRENPTQILSFEAAAFARPLSKSSTRIPGAFYRAIMWQARGREERPNENKELERGGYDFTRNSTKFSINRGKRGWVYTPRLRASRNFRRIRQGARCQRRRRRQRSGE